LRRDRDGGGVVPSPSSLVARLDACGSATLKPVIDQVSPAFPGEEAASTPT
jgi:hypothetical protein